VAPRSNPGFRTQVWARIEAARRPSTWTSFARAHPAVVSALLVAAILAGAWTGRTEARDHMRADQEAIAATYVHALDARWMRHP
jgi:hypothetical protein